MGLGGTFPVLGLLPKLYLRTTDRRMIAKAVWGPLKFSAHRETPEFLTQ